MATAPYYVNKPITQMTTQEWESLCDGCGLCCQIRVRDIDTDEVALSNVACRYLCLNSHQCSDYANRFANVADCVKVTPENIYELDWLPHSCAYRLVAYGQPLPDWHYLICGDKQAVHGENGVSMNGELISEDEAEWEE